MSGLKEKAGDRFIALDSPFNHVEQGKIVIPQMRYEPLIDNEEQHIAEMAAYFREQLPQADYRALLSAQRRERTAFDLAAACAANYEAIEELKISYDTITAETPAAVLYERYRTLQSLNRSLCDSLQRVWGAVYDNKNYAYAYVLDRLGRDDLLAKTEEQLAGVRQQMASERGRYYCRNGRSSTWRRSWPERWG